MKTDIFLQNKYTKWYYNIIDRAILRVNIEPNEKHHIIPESFYLNRKRSGPPGVILGDANDPMNLVQLSPKEHLLCHKLLVKMTTGKFKAKMYKALYMTCIYGNTHQRTVKLTSRQYERIILELRNNLLGKTYEELYGEEKAKMMRIEKSIANTGIKNPFFNKQHSDETKEKMSISASKPKSKIWKESASVNRKGKTPHNKNKTFEESYGTERAAELKKKVANAGEKNGFFGKKHSEEQRQRKRAEKLEAPKLKCYYCSKEVDQMNYARWHGDKCKHKGINE
jgi:hypothetical protein